MKSSPIVCAVSALAASLTLTIRKALVQIGLLSALAGGLLIASPASAGPTVDPGTLTPPPPPGAQCRLNGQSIICQTSIAADLVNEPIFELPCGQVYETSHDARSGIRFYNANGLLEKRFVTQDVDGTWSLSPTGAGPTVNIRINDNWWIVLAVPGDESTGALTAHGNGFTASSPGFGVISHIAGLDPPDGSGHRGVSRLIEDDPEAAAELCEALTG